MNRRCIGIGFSIPDPTAQSDKAKAQYLMSVSSEKTENKGGLGETIKVVAQALVLALILRTFLFQPFNIPSGSMMDNLLIGDYLFVSKYSYGYSQHSFPYGLGPFSDRIFAEEPKRGDIAVFKLPRNTSIDYIKRVVGLPGDEIQVTDGILHINGVAVKREQTDDFIETDRYGNVRRSPRYIETLPNGVSYTTLDMTPRGTLDNTGVYKVPAGHFFMMGDNRDNSQDSRVTGAVGYVPFENFVGRAEVLFFSVKNGEPAWKIWNWPWSVRWDRLFKTL